MTEADEKRLAAETIAWLREREENCRRIAKAKVGSDRDGWLEDAAYFNSAITLLARATQAESALLAFLDKLIEEGPTRKLHLAFAETYHRNDDEDADVWRPDDFRHAFDSMLRALRTEIAEER